MPSRRALLTALGCTVTAATAGCVDSVRNTLQPEPPIDGPCTTPDVTWPTAGGDPGRTGRTTTAPPAADADVVDLLAGVTPTDGRRTLAGGLPAVADGIAYVPASTGIVAVALDAPEEGARWRYDPGGGDFDAVPTLACGAVLAPGVNRLVALAPDSGERYWRADAGALGPAAATATGETTYVAGTGPVAIETRTGERQWQATGGDTVAVGPSGIYTTRNANGTGDIYAHRRDGTQQWHLALGKLVGSASVVDGTVYVADTQGRVFAIDATTGVTRWSRSLAGVGGIDTGLAVADELVIVPAGSGTRSVALDARSGETRWAADTGFVTSRPLVGDDWVALGRTNEGVTLYDRATGARRRIWRRGASDLGTIDGIAAVENGVIVREGSRSGLRLLR